MFYGQKTGDINDASTQNNPLNWFHFYFGGSPMSPGLSNRLWVLKPLKVKTKL